MEYVAALVGGGRAAAAFLFGLHSVFCVGRFAAKNTCSTFERAPRPRFFIYPLCAFFRFSPFIAFFCFAQWFQFPFTLLFLLALLVSFLRFVVRCFPCLSLPC